MVKAFTRPNFCLVFFTAAAILFSYKAQAAASSPYKTVTLFNENGVINTPTITFNTDLESKPYGTADFIPATSTSSAPITFSSSNTAVATVVNGKIHITGLGSSTITATQDANSQFSATTVTATLTVIQSTPQITFINNLSPKAYTTTDFTAAIATFNAPIIYTTDNPAVATIINNNIHLVSTGTVNITATIAASAQYVGTSRSIALTVQKSTPVISFISGLNAKAFTSQDFSPAIVSPAVPVTYTSDDLNVATIINNNVHLVGTGTVNITATITGNDLYDSASQTTSLTVIPSTPVITFADLSAKQYTSADFSPATVSPTVPVAYSSDNPAVATIINNNVHLVGVGSANITASITGSSLYSSATRTTVLNVIKSTPVIKFINGLNAKAYSIQDFNPATITPAVPVTYTSDNPAVATIINNNVHLVGIGTANITANIAPSTLYNSTTQTTTLNVVNATPVISFIASLNNKPFTTQDFAPATINPVLPIIYTSDNPAVATIINNNVHLIGLGTANITATVTGTNLYNGTTQTAPLNVVQATPVISFVAGLNAKPFTSANFTPATASPGLPIIFTSDNPAVATIINNTVHLVGLGTANITATIAATDLYSGLTQSTTLNVVPSAPVLSFIAGLNNKPFTTIDFAPASTNPQVPILFTSDNPSVATIINNNVHLIGIGTANITATVAGTSAYPGFTSTSPLTVVKATPIISFMAGFNAKPFTANDFVAATSNPSLPIIFNSDNPAVATIINNNVHLIGLGTANITATIDGSSNVYYNSTSATQTLTVTQGNPIISFIAGLNAKPYTTSDFTPATANPAIPIIFTSDNPDVATIINNNVHLVGLGTANIKAKTASSTLYNAINANTALTVVKATPVISFIAGLNAKQFTTTDFAPASANPALPITYTSDNPAVATIINNQVHLVGIGTANITATILPTTLYNGVTATTPLVVIQANPIISFVAGLNAKQFTTGNFTPATSNPAVPITFTSDNPAVATIVNNQIHLTGLGIATITATIDGSNSNGLYNSITASTPLTVTQATPIISFVPGLNAKQYTSVNFIPASSNPAVPITYTSDNPDVATIINNQVHIVAMGTANITATIDGSVSNGLYNSATATTPLTVTKATPVISFVAGLNAKAFTTTDFVPATVNPVLPITYSIDPSQASVATIVNNQVHLVGPGTATITATVDGSSTTLYNSTSSTSSLVVTKSAPAITFIAGLNSKPYGTTDFIPATAAPVVPITYQSSDLSVATIVNGRVHIVGLGTTTITATIANTNQYSGTTASATLTISRSTPVITFASNLSPRFYGSGNFNPASATLGAPITYTLSNNNVLSITGSNAAQIIGTGTVTITATTPNSNLYAGATASATVTINKSTPVISFIAGLNAKAYTAINFTPATATFSAPITFTSDNPAVATIVNNQVHLVGLGLANITATTPNNAFYEGQTLTTVLNVIKSTPVITFVSNFSPRDYGTANFTPASATLGAPVTFTSDNPAVATILNGQVHIVAPGTANITGTTPNNTFYNGATLTAPLTVNKATPILTFAALPIKTYGDNADGIALSATTTNTAVPITYSSDNTGVATIGGPNNNILFIVGAGTANITASQAGNDFYKPVSVTNNFSVNRTDQFISFAPLTAKTYGDADFNLTATASSGTVSYTSSNNNVATVTGNTVHIVGAGVTTITAMQNGTDNYNTATPIQQTLTVNKADQTITFNTIADKTFNEGSFDITGSTSSGLGITYASSDPTVAVVNGSMVSIIGVGSVTITASQNGNDNYNTATSVQQTFNIGKADQLITFNPLEAQSLGDANFTLNGTASSGLAVEYASSNPAVATISGNVVNIIGVGYTVITATQNGNDTYNPAIQVQQTLTVGRGNQTITFNPLPGKTFGDTGFSLTATTSSGLGVSYTSSDTNVATINGNTVTIVGAGSTTIIAAQAGDDNYNAAAVVQQALNVNKATQTITFNPLPDGSMDDAGFDLSASATSGLAISYASSNPAVATVNGNRVTVLSSGSADITASQAGNANYNAAIPVTRTLHIGKQNQNITFTTLPVKTLGDADFSLNATSTNISIPVTYSSSNTAVATIINGSIHITGAGVTTITAAQNGNANYNAAVSVSQALTVGKGIRSISFSGPIVKTYGDADFDGGATSAGSDAIAYTIDNAAVATVINGKIHINGAGNANITASLPENANYLAAQNVSQQLIVNKANQTISFSAVPTLHTGVIYDLSIVKASSGLPVSFTSNNPKIAAVNGQSLTAFEIGEVNITASQPGNANYNAANNVIQSANVQDPSGQEIIVHQAMSPNGDGINDVLFIEGINEHPINRVSLINRNGVKIYEVNNYDNVSRAFDGHSNITGALMQPGTYFYLVEYMVDGVGRHKTGYFVLKY